jgi:hypothetical protein
MRVLNRPQITSWYKIDILYQCNGISLTLAFTVYETPNSLHGNDQVPSTLRLGPSNPVL